jgi:exodeoxyribonuclease V alpha subunit
MSDFENAAFAGTLSPIDRRFAEMLRRKDESAQAQTVAISAAVISAQRGLGQSCILLREWAGKRVPEKDGIVLPDEKKWLRELKESSLVSNGSRPAPLVLDASGRAYLYRYWAAEQKLVKHIRSRLERPPEQSDFTKLAPLFQRLFPPEDKRVEWQAVAAASCLRHSFAVISGGPGTGKTTTVARVLALLLERNKESRISLAAPTGKAAARLAEMISEQASILPISDTVRERIPKSAQTLHRFLGYDPIGDQFRYNVERLKSVDTLIVDEASMVDLLLMEATFEALPASARVILLGDSGQLASVETGYVLGDICRAAGSGEKSAIFARDCQILSGRKLAPAKGARALGDAVVELQVNWRFEKQPGISSAAMATRAGRSDEVLKLLSDRTYPDLVWSEPGAMLTAEKRVDPVAPHLGRLMNADSPAQALEELAAFRILCAIREGPWGVSGCNTAVEHWLRQRGWLDGKWYRGRPILVTANDYNVRLFNGDVGICWPDGSGTFAWFSGEDQPRRIPLAKLPQHETAWAMTVHKSQGSEFNHILLVLPDRDVPLLTRELFYTGITRAGKSVHITGSADLIRAAVERTAVRNTGLCDALSRS